MADEEQIKSSTKDEDRNDSEGVETENEDFSKDELCCRFYKNEFPEVEDLVMVSAYSFTS